MRLTAMLLTGAVLLAGCVDAGTEGDDAAAADTSADTAAAGQAAALPPGAEGAEQRLASSPRHGEWTMVQTGANDSVRAWVVYPEREDPAPVVVVVHEIFGLSNWVRSVADQLAAEGYIAVAPDLLSDLDVAQTEAGEPDPDAARTAIRDLEDDDVHRELRAVAEWAMALPAAADTYGIVGFCWGGSTTFEHATRYDDLGAAVVYYGSAPDSAALANVSAPVLGLYGGDDERVNATIPAADSVLTALGQTYEPNRFEGAGHGFLRQQDGRDGANQRAADQAWPMTVAWFDQYLGGT